jgi:hypothetical protein
MAELTGEQREGIAAEVFAKTEIPLSKDDPIFALVQILSIAQEKQQAEIKESNQQAATALRAVADLIEKRTNNLESTVDAFLESRMEAANTTIDMETKRLTGIVQDELTAFATSLSDNIADTLKRSVEKECIAPIRDALDVIPQRTWLESLWTLTACLAIGFAVGFIYFDGTIRYSLEYQLNAVTSRLPPAPSPSTKKS